MSKPYAQLRAQMSPEAQRQAEARARALADTRTPDQRAFAVYHRHRRPDAHAAGVPVINVWQLLPSSEREMWDAIAQAAQEEPPHA